MFLAMIVFPLTTKFFFFYAISSHSEPTTYSQAAKILEWNEAMMVELKTFESNGTWTLTTLPVSKHLVGCKWVYHIKYRSNGSLEHYEAHLVAKRYAQQEGINYLDTFSHVAKLVMVKVLFSLSIVYGWSLTQLDVNNVFLHSDLQEEVYMELPPGYHHEGEISLLGNTVCRLHKSIYGLKQAPHQWFSKFSTILFEISFK